MLRRRHADELSDAKHQRPCLDLLLALMMSLERSILLYHIAVFMEKRIEVMPADESLFKPTFTVVAEFIYSRIEADPRD